MDKILLIISDWNLRQLYHELLFSKTVEIVPIAEISDATVLLMLSSYRKAILHTTFEHMDEIELFLSLRNRHIKLSKTELIILTDNVEFYKSLIRSNDVILGEENLTPKEISVKVKQLLKLPI